MLRISTTTLESFRLYLEPSTDWMDEADLIATIKGEFVPTPQILLGRAFGSVLEKPGKYRVPHGYEYVDRLGNRWQFSDETMAPAFKLLDYEHGIFEAKGEKRYGEANVVAKPDYLIGAHLREFKTTEDQFDFDKYANSYQWRFMVDIFEPAYVTYDVFRLDDHENGVVELKDVDSFNLFPYPELHDDCARLVGHFVDYVHAKGLAELLEARQRKAEAAA